MPMHFLPKTYQIGFSTPDDTVWVYDMKTGKRYPTKRAKAAASNNLYTDETENLLSKEIETRVGPILRKLRNYHFLNSGEKEIVSAFIANMLMRVPKNKELIARVAPTIANNLLWDMAREYTTNTGNSLSQGAPALKKIRSIIEGFDQTELIFDHMAQPNRLPDFQVELNRMRWQFLISNKPNFVTSDNPVFFARHLGLKDSELVCPISTELVLWANRGSTLIQGQFVTISQELIDRINQQTIESAQRFIYFSANAEWIAELIFARKNQTIAKYSEK